MNRDRLVLKPKIFSIRGALGGLVLVLALAGGALWFFKQGHPTITYILGGAGGGALLLLVSHVFSLVQVDGDGVHHRTLFSRRNFAWSEVKVVEISEVRASSPFTAGDTERTLAVFDAAGHTISVNLTMWHGYEELESLIQERRFGGDYELRGLSPKVSGGSCSRGSCD